MKHDLKVTLFLVLLFIAAQLAGLFLLKQSIASIDIREDGSIYVNYSEPITGRPELEKENSFTYMIVMILVGTGLLLLLIKFRLFKVWKAWFFLAVWGALTIALSTVMGDIYGAALALLLAALKIFRPNAIVHNLTEVFMYAGIAIMLSPIFTVFWVSMLLIVISIYDAIAVWQSKHMIVLAEAQSQNRMFAGLLLPYKTDSTKISPGKIDKAKDRKAYSADMIKSELKLEMPKDIRSGEVKSAILGGGDIAFPLIFTGTVMTWLIESGMSSSVAFMLSLIITATASVALFLLFVKSEKGKFYPAMPFLSAGCFIGLGIIYLL